MFGWLNLAAKVIEHKVEISRLKCEVESLRSCREDHLNDQRLIADLIAENTKFRNEAESLKPKPAEPAFKVGDRVRLEIAQPCDAISEHRRKLRGVVVQIVKGSRPFMVHWLDSSATQGYPASELALDVESIAASAEPAFKAGDRVAYKMTPSLMDFYYPLPSYLRTPPINGTVVRPVSMASPDGGSEMQYEIDWDYEHDGNPHDWRMRKFYPAEKLIRAES